MKNALLNLKNESTLCFIAFLAVFAMRLSVGIFQIDPDEELYFINSRWWGSEGLMIYRDLFDHHPPLVFLYYKITSLWNTSIFFVRFFSAILLMGSIIHLWDLFKDRLHCVFPALCFALLSTPFVVGVNTEIIYIPFLIFAFTLSYQNKYIAAGISAGVAVAIKYTVALDLTGIALGLLLLGKSSKQLTLTLCIAITTFILIMLSFVIYFDLNHINVIYESIGRSILYSHLDSSRDNWIIISPYFIFLLLPLSVLILLPLRKALQSQALLNKYIYAMLIWSFFSFLQTQVTSTGAYHYFIPIFIPLALITAHLLSLNNSTTQNYLIKFSLASIILCSVSIPSAYAYKYKKDVDRLSFACQLDDFQYHGDDLFIYRLCGNHQPPKYLFHICYTSDWFIKSCGSHGLDWLTSVDKKIIYDKKNSLKVFNNGTELKAFLENKAATDSK